ncbi:hypothetical protein FOFC_08869 [Fusarium oxysporum]|nr:hypothetical protein FOFC_08869 [Fusarium oxysporum]
MSDIAVTGPILDDADDFETFIDAPPTRIAGSPLEWLLHRDQRKAYPRLSRKAIDILSIPPELSDREHGLREPATWLKENGVVDSWKHPMKRTANLRKWEGISVAEVYVWLGILIYMGIHKERTTKSHWSTPQPGIQRPEHSIIKFMPYWKFQLIHRHLRPFDHSKIDETSPLPKVFQAADEWSDHI